MAVQTFNPTDLSQSATNWAVAQRIVGPFAPHAQLVPNVTLALDPGYLLNGTTLTEVGAQSVGPFVPPSSGFRIDRVVVDRTTGAASIVAGTANSLTPPAIPSGKLPVARVMLQTTTAAITNELIVDERALFDLTPGTNSLVACRVSLGGVDQTGVPNGTSTKVRFSSATINTGNGFDTANCWFKPSIAGTYQFYAQIVTSLTGVGSSNQIELKKNGTLIAVNSITAGSSTYAPTATVSDIATLNGSTDYIEIYAYLNGSNNTVFGGNYYSFFTAMKIA